MRTEDSLLRPMLLTRQHDSTGFSCGQPPLNRYIEKYAVINQDSDISRTYVATRGQRIAGYYTLAFGSISHEQAAENIKKGLPGHPIPIILLPRLAVDLSEKGKGLRKALLRDAMLRTIQAADIGGLRTMLTHAKDETAASFYKKYGFIRSPLDTLTLMLSIKDIRNNLI